MGLRETLNENPRLTTGITIGLIALALILIVVWMWPSRSGVPGAAAGHYYTDDDGKTTFVDEPNKPTPFDHNGKQAVRARVFRCGEKGKPFVGYLEKLTPAGKKQLEKFQSEPGNKNRLPRMLMAEEALVKKPGDAQWLDVVQSPEQAQDVRSNVKCPGGGPDEFPEEVLPE